MDYWKTANVTQLKRWILIHHVLLQQCAKRGKQQKRMKVRDIRRYLKGSENDKNPSTTEHQTSKDTNVTNKEQYGIGKAHGPQTQKKGNRHHKGRQKETTQIKDIRQFFAPTGTNKSTKNNQHKNKNKEPTQKKDGTSKTKKPADHNYTKITQYYSTQDKPPDNVNYVQQKLNIYIEKKNTTKEERRSKKK